MDTEYTSGKDPFVVTQDHAVEKEVLLMEHVANAIKLYDFIPRAESDAAVLSVILQTLAATVIAQKHVHFTHYDLHSQNVLVRRCDPQLVCLYVVDDETAFAVPTHGNAPTIIDYGFAYAKTLEHGPAWPSLGHTQHGFTSTQYDKWADAKLLLVTTSSELQSRRPGAYADTYRRLVKNMFGKMTIDWETGWDTGETASASDRVVEAIYAAADGKSSFFTSHGYYCYDILQSLVVLPLEHVKSSHLHQSCRALIKEFSKIERQVKDPELLLYVLKGAVDVAREVRGDYVSGRNIKAAVDYFRLSVVERINCVASYCRVDNLHPERLLCALLCLASDIEQILFSWTYNKGLKTMETNAEMPLDDASQVLHVLQTNLSDPYTYTTDTKVVVWDASRKLSSMMRLTDAQCKRVNTEHAMLRGARLRQWYEHQLGQYQQRVKTESVKTESVTPNAERSPTLDSQKREPADAGGTPATPIVV